MLHDLIFSLELFILFRNEFHSRIKFVLHSHEIERVSRRRSHPHGLRARSDIRHSLKSTDFAIFNQNKVFKVPVNMVQE